MSWGATAYTPIITRNEPPFGFAENPNPPDFKTCNTNPWASGDMNKEEIQQKLLVESHRRSLENNDKIDGLVFDKPQLLRCAQKDKTFSDYDYHLNSLYENFTTFGFSQQTIILLLLALIFIYTCKTMNLM